MILRRRSYLRENANLGSFYKRQLTKNAGNLANSIDQSDKGGILQATGAMLRLITGIVSMAGATDISGKLEQMGNDLIGRSGKE